MSDVAQACAVGYHVYRTFHGWDASRRTASMGQCEVQIQADGRRAEPIHWKSPCLIGTAITGMITGPLMHGFELARFRCGMPAAVCFVLAV